MKRFIGTSFLLLLPINTSSQTNDIQVRGGYETWGQPSVVGIYSQASNPSKGGVCTGVLVTRRMVLTAAHCGSQTLKYVRFDPVGSGGKNPTWVEIKSFTPYTKEDYSGRDIAVIELTDEAPSYIREVTIVPARKLSTFSTQKIVGYGLSEKSSYGIKSEAFIKIWSNDCTQVFKQGNASLLYGCIPGREMVAGDVKTLRDSCPGDSGGPVFVSMPEGEVNWGLVALVSRGTGMNKKDVCGNGGVYTLVGLYEDWLSSKFKIPKAKSQPLKVKCSDCNDALVVM